MATSKITIHMVASLDGFIAKRDESIDWMESTSRYEAGVDLTEQHIQDFLNSIDCYVMGARTYQKALRYGWSYGETPVFVVTHQPMKNERTTVSFFSGDLRELVDSRLKPLFNNIWMVGGSMLTKEFLRLNLADEIVITFVPIMLGDGLLFFDCVGTEQKLLLKDVRTYQNGLVELKYEILKIQQEN